MIKTLTLMLVSVCLYGLSFGQQAVYQQVDNLVKQGRSFRQVKVFNFSSSDVKNRDLKISGLSEGVILDIDQTSIQQLRNSENELIQLDLPVSDRQNLKINLVRHQIFTEDFAVTLSDGTTLTNYKPGLYYKGAVEGMPHSVVAISIFDDEVMGMIATDNGNFVIGPIENNREKQHILYNDANLDFNPDMTCGTPDNGIGYTEKELKPQIASRDAGDCVRVYIEIDDDIVTQKGGSTQATNYITGLFNQSIVLYNNESVSMMINQIYAWTTTSPYTGSTSGQMLTSFQNLTGEFNGNVAILVSYQTSGGIAVLDGLCQTNPDWRKSFAAIHSSYSNVPTYSWSVMVVTHEIGHVIGSKHTHACAWNGNNTAIDGCAGSTEGGCPNPGIPAGGGTIMSYCHLTGAGINFTLGFGPQPGTVIRNKVNATNNCLTSCGPPPPPPPPAYCSSAGTNSTYEWINKVVLGSINNTSGNNGGYRDYTNLSTNLNAGTAYSINLTPAYAGGTYLEYWRVWIDYNNDLDWADTGEQVAQGSGTTAINLSFTVPAGTANGTKRMRIAMKYSGYAALCENFAYGEVEDYNVVIGSGGGGGTCSDGQQNQGETGIDCGGPCPACASCSDGTQNQGETGIDCGGPCPACPPPPGGNTTLLASYFETGWDSWLDGGSDVTRVSSTNSYEGSYSIRIADNSSTQSAMTSPNFSMVGGTGATIQFYFKTSSMEVGEDFWVRYNNGTGWVTIGTFVSGTNFTNGTFYVTTVAVPNFLPTMGTFRIQCDASDDNDQVYIDKVTITRLGGTALPEAYIDIQEVTRTDVGGLGHDDIAADIGESLKVYPNPVSDILNVDFNGQIHAVRVINVQGQDMRVNTLRADYTQIDINSLTPGIYILNIKSGEEWYPIRFSKM